MNCQIKSYSPRNQHWDKSDKGGWAAKLGGAGGESGKWMELLVQSKQASGKSAMRKVNP